MSMCDGSFSPLLFWSFTHSATTRNPATPSVSAPAWAAETLRFRYRSKWAGSRCTDPGGDAFSLRCIRAGRGACSVLRKKKTATGAGAHPSALPATGAQSNCTVEASAQQGFPSSAGVQVRLPETLGKRASGAPDMIDRGRSSAKKLLRRQPTRTAPRGEGLL